MQILKDVFCGWMSGIGQVLTMMPFENIKIKVVTKPQQYTGYLQCFKKTIAEEGAMSFYKGMLMNLLGVGPQVALQFGTTMTVKRLLKEKLEPLQKKLSLKYTALSGMVAGIPSALVITPLDHARFRVALSKSKIQGGSITVAKQILAEHGLAKLYSGFVSTLCRESLGLGIYFVTYSFLMSRLNRDDTNPSLMSALLAGGVAGMMTWTFAYPLDFIKTMVQSDSLEKPRHTGMMGYLREQIAKGSVKNIFRGFQIMLARAFVVNAFGFYCYEIGRLICYGAKQQS